MAAMSVQKKSWLDQQNDDQLAARDRYVPALIAHAQLCSTMDRMALFPERAEESLGTKTRSLKLN